MSRIRYRPEIDGLRAVAVMAVILHHAQFRELGVFQFSGGYLGVDVFFVISGYLITLILLRSLEAGQFSLMNFWERRVRRIIPALFLVVLATLPMSWWLLFPPDLKAFAGSVWATVFFVSNIWFYRHVSYWDAEGLGMPLLHTWSLAVEEQYYLVYPVFLWWVFSRHRSALPAILLTVALASLLLAQLGSVGGGSGAFFLLPTRAWELAAGALVALLQQQRGRQPASVTARYGSWLGAVVLLPCFLLFDEWTPHPSFLTVLPVLATCLIIWFTMAPSPLHALLASRPFVATGKISYGLYLWHFPIFVFARLLDPGFGVMTRLGCIALTFLLAAASYRWVETPARDSSRVSLKSLMWTLLAAALCMLAVSGFMRYSDGAPERFAKFEQFVDFGYWLPERGHQELFKTHPGCWLDGAEYSDLEHCRAREPEPSGPRVMVVGDSHVAGLVPGLIQRYGRDRVLQRVGNACGFAPARRDFCSAMQASVLREVREQSPAVIIVGGNVKTRASIETLVEYAKALRAESQAQVLILGPLPRWSISGSASTLPARLANHYIRNRIAYEPPVWLEVGAITFQAEGWTRDAAQADGFPFLSVVEGLCDPPRCRTRVDDAPDGITSFDGVHLTHKASIFVVDDFGDQLDSVLESATPEKRSR